MRKLGQHFLKNKAILQLIAESLTLTLGDVVIEIGPGHGELTDFLALTHVKKIIAIEKDEGLCLSLSKKFQLDDRVIVIAGDALKILPSVIREYDLLPNSYKVVGNIPYYITGHLLRMLGESDIKPELCLFTIQKEVAERACAAPPHMNRLAASVQFWATAKIMKILPASDFSPPPKVSSAIIVLKTTVTANSGMENYYTAVRALFAQPRKTLLNNLTEATGQKRDILIKKLLSLNLEPSDRPQDLSVSDITMIADKFFDVI